MVTLRQINIVSFCLFPTLIVAMDFDKEALQMYKKAITAIVNEGRSVADQQNNKVLQVYSAEATRVAAIDDPQNMFDPKTSERINELLAEVKRNAEYSSTFNEFTASIKVTKSHPSGWFDNGKAMECRMTAVQIMFGLIEQRGIRLPERPGSGSAGFLEANANIAQEPAQYLVPAQACLMAFPCIMRKAFEERRANIADTTETK